MSELTTAVSGERRKIAQALHDGLCQQLTGLSLMTHSLVEGLKRDQHPLLTEALRVHEVTKSASADLHRVLTLLRTA